MIVALGIPWDANSSYLRGPALAPEKIREAYHSPSSNYFSESGLNTAQEGVWHDAGDVAFNSQLHFAEAISSAVKKNVFAPDQLIAFGGDHSVTFPLLQAMFELHGPVNILHIDAHPDLYELFEDNQYSHASPFARIIEKGFAKRLVQVGIRTLNAHQRQQARRFGVEVVEMKDWSSDLRWHFDGPMYLSLDMDAIDPAFAPGVSHHEPGGFTSRELISLLQNLKGKMVGADLVEYNPLRDINGVTAMLAAKLFKEMIGLLSRNPY